MKILKYSLLICLVSFAMGCDEDKFSQVKTIELPEHTPQLAVTSAMGTFYEGPSEDHQVFVSNSLGVLETTEFDIFKDASVRLFKDDNLFLDFTFDEQSVNYLPNSNQTLTEGTYRLEVDVDGYDPVNATQVLPSKAEIVGATYEEDKVLFDIDQRYDLFEVEIQDNGGEENFYVYDVFLEIENTSNGSIIMSHEYVDTDDPLVEYGDEFSIIPDISFNGNKHRLRLLVDTYLNDNQRIKSATARIYTISKDYYLYEISKRINYDAQENPFAEPILIHSNFEGGFGTFALFNMVEYTLDL